LQNEPTEPKQDTPGSTGLDQTRGARFGVVKNEGKGERGGHA